jgi:hypothetical protein|tara:strand:- start:113 stop:1540 length:1428 start_codon:yes stop_codon:yes gene_type:complete
MKINIFATIFILYCNLISVSQNKEDIINQNLFGFCTSNSFTYVDTYDTSFISKVEQINPKVLRFPGGTIGNFYHTNKAAYGFNTSDVDQWYSGKFSTRVNSLKQASKRRGHTHDYIEDFIVLAKNINAKVVVNANILTAEKSEIISILNRFEQERIEVLGVELGSELSNRAYKKNIKSVYDYIQLAKKCSENIKSSFPDMKVAVVSAPLKERMPNRLKNWNSILAKENFYDAIVHHSYHTIVDGEADAGVMISEKAIIQSKKGQFNVYKNRILIELKSGFVSRMLEYNSIFNNKEIWITEWNLQMTKTTGNTMLQSLFVSHYLLEILCNPALQNIEIATYHNLAGRDVSGSIFKGNNESFITHSTYFPFSMLSGLFEKNIIKIKKEKMKVKDAYIYNCYNSNNKIQMSYIINWSSKDSYYYANENMNLFNSFYSKNLYDRAHKKGGLSSDSYMLDGNYNLLIRPYSISVIEGKNE